MRFRYNLLSVLWTIVIVVLCCIPGQAIPDASFLDIPHFDKIVHFGLYFVLAIITVKGFAVQNCLQQLRAYPYIYTLLYAFILGTVIEFLQHNLIPFRSGDGWDMLANILGCLAGIVCIQLRIAPQCFLLRK